MQFREQSGDLSEVCGSGGDGMVSTMKRQEAGTGDQDKTDKAGAANGRRAALVEKSGKVAGNNRKMVRYYRLRKSLSSYCSQMRQERRCCQLADMRNWKVGIWDLASAALRDDELDPAKSLAIPLA